MQQTSKQASKQAGKQNKKEGTATENPIIKDSTNICCDLKVNLKT